jgi:hypothetical protein
MESEENIESGLERDDLLKHVEGSGFFVADGWQKPLAPLDLGTARWTPDYVKPDSALAIVLGPRVPGFLEKRLKAAYIAGVQLLCVIDWAALSSGETLLLLSEVDAQVALVSEGATVSTPLPLLKFLGVEQFGIDATVRRELIRHGIAECFAAATNDMKGKRLEWLLHFMFSQVGDFRVKSCNYRTASEELDVVIQLTAMDGRRCWAHLSAPFLVAEAKNRKEKSGQEVVSKLNTIMSVKRGACKIGFIVSLSGFTSDANTQVLKLATQDRVFVLMDQAELERWGFAKDYDQELDDIVSEAILD